jgi:hypothetical protein
MMFINAYSFAKRVCVEYPSYILSANVEVLGLAYEEDCRRSVDDDVVLDCHMRSRAIAVF